MRDFAAHVSHTHLFFSHDAVFSHVARTFARSHTGDYRLCLADIAGAFAVGGGAAAFKATVVASALELRALRYSGHRDGVDNSCHQNVHEFSILIN